MPLFKLPAGAEINLIGDPHLGRTFRTNVPLHRVGDREAMVWREFEAQLNTKAAMTIIMGDLFDKFVVAPEVVLRTFQLLRSAATVSQPIYILRGNHDASRDSTKSSSFELLEELCAGRGKSIQFVTTSLFLGLKNGGYLHLFGWQPFVSAADAVSKAMRIDRPETALLTVAFGHWDITQHGENDHNTIPLQQLKDLGVRTVYTGHIHKATEMTMHGIDIKVVGSMQPYAHGEEPEGSTLYRTLTPTQVDVELDHDEEAFANTNVRILLLDGESYDREFNCLSRSFKRLAADVEDGEDRLPEAGYDTFDLKTMITTTLTDNGVSKALQARIEAALLEKMYHA